MPRIFEYFVVCGIGPEIRTVYEDKGFHGIDMMYLPSLLDQYPQSDPKLHSPPPQLPTVSHQIPSFSFLWIMRIAWICRYYQGKCFASLFWWHLKLHFPVRFTRWSRVLLFWVQFQWCINIPSKLPYSLDRCVVAFVGIYVNVKGKDMLTNGCNLFMKICCI